MCFEDDASTGGRAFILVSGVKSKLLVGSVDDRRWLVGLRLVSGVKLRPRVCVDVSTMVDWRAE